MNSTSCFEFLNYFRINFGSTSFVVSFLPLLNTGFLRIISTHPDALGLPLLELLVVHLWNLRFSSCHFSVCLFVFYFTLSQSLLVAAHIHQTLTMLQYYLGNFQEVLTRCYQLGQLNRGFLEGCTIIQRFIMDVFGEIIFFCGK